MQLSKVDCAYGAPMGRSEKHLTGDVGPVKMSLIMIALDSGGYDSGGTYWGLRPHGVTLYGYEWAGNIPSPGKPILIRGFIDAASREDAKAQIRAQYPQATFYR